VTSVSDVWRGGVHPWAVLYRRFSESEALARPLGRVVFGLDVRALAPPRELVDAVPDGGAVLDAPCGPGNALEALAPAKRVRWVAADIAPAMLERTAQAARRRGLSQVRTKEADLLALPFGDAEFDLCLSLLGLHCVPDPAGAVAELGRVLRPGGQLFGTIFVTDAGVRYWPVRQAGRAAGILGPSGGLDDLRTWLSQAGLELEDAERLGTIVRFRARRRG